MAARKNYTAAQIINGLRRAEVGLANGKSMKEVIRDLGVSEQTYYRWRREYGGMKTSQAQTAPGGRLHQSSHPFPHHTGHCSLINPVECPIVVDRFRGRAGHWYVATQSAGITVLVRHIPLVVSRASILVLSLL